jgi:spore cortex biosynthesis protein YabQ
MLLDTFYTVTEQAELFLLSVLVGAALGVVFDAFRLIRAVFLTARKSFLVHAADFLFVLIYALTIFTYSAVLARGEIRFFILVGSLCGFLLETLTIGDSVTKAIRYVSDKIHAFLRRVYNAFCASLLKFMKKFRHNNDSEEQA